MGILVRTGCVLAALGCLGLAACGDDDDSGTAMESFALQFAATAGGDEVGCTDTIEGVGPTGEHEVGMSDLRFYISNLEFRDADGNEVDVELDANEFQYHADSGFVGLIDLTSNTEGTCSSNSIAFAEGTARTNFAITGTTHVGDVAEVSFDVGVPQPVMQEVIAENTIEAAPSPLNEMYWSWATGYRHFVFNLAVDAPDGESGDGYLHVGSRDCGPEDGKALEDRDECTYINTPRVTLTGFDLETNTVAVDLTEVLSGLDFVAPIYDPETFEVIGEGPGLECHSAPSQPDCAIVFESFGIDFDTGDSTAAADDVFSMM